ncbi:MAG: DegQ family serine endoprotease [Gammaproteobacteria bacterium]
MKTKSTLLIKTAALLLLVGAAAWVPGAQAALPTVDSQGQALPSLAPMLDRVLPSVVNIATESRVRVQDNPLLQDPFFRRFFGVPNVPHERKTQALGSGVIVDAKHGYVLTNNHVGAQADEITVTLKDGRSLQAKLVGTDPETDIAVVQIPAHNLTAVPLSDSDKLRVGDFVVAIGNPFGLGQTVTSGIVSALGRTGLGIEGYEDFIQTDASINPGNSGGALVNLQGQLIGINTAIIAPGGGNVGIGFAIPVNMAKEVMTQLIQHGEVHRGRLGILVQDLTPDLAKAFDIKETHGAVISRVVKDSPAQRAGLKSGDVVIGVNGKPVATSSELRTSIGLLPVGTTVSLEVVRDGKTRTIKVTIAETAQDKLPGKRINPRLEGAVFGAIEEGSPEYGHLKGIVVLDLARGSPAWAAGLRKNDVIVSVNRRPVTSLDEFQRAARSGSRGLLLNIRRGDGALFILIQ